MLAASIYAEPAATTTAVDGAVLAAKTSGGADIPATVSPEVAHAYGTGIAELFLLTAPLGLIVLTVLAFMRERPLGRQSGMELAARDLGPQGA